MLCKRLVATLAIMASLSVPALADPQPGDPHVGGGGRGGAPAGGVPRGGGHYTGSNGAWMSHPAWTGGGQFNHWRAGHWWRGTYEGRYGAWWIVGPDWYWYATEVAPIPDPYTPPGMAPGYWYWCETYGQYYPYVGACPAGWQPVQPR